jgi:hypothetical protein
MNREINVSKFYITIGGDPDVGIPNIYYELGSNFIFDNHEHLIFFKEKLIDAFKETFDAPIGIETEEEINKKENEIEKTMLEAKKADENFEEPPMTNEELKEAIKKDWSDE